MEQNRFSHYYLSLPVESTATRPLSTSSSAASADSERTAIRKDALRLYQSEELSSIYDSNGFGAPLTSVDTLTRKERKSDDESSPRGGVVDGLVGDVREDSNIVDWDGELDRENPRNWSTWKKSVNVACILLMCIVSPFTSTVIAPVIPDIMAEFLSKNSYLSTFVLSVYVLGYAFGMLLFSPLSEVYGRRPLYYLSNMLFTVFAASCGRANNLVILIVLRLFAGMGGSSAFALAPSSLADMFGEKRSTVMVLVAIGQHVIPAISPIAGVYVNAVWGWRWIFVISGIAGAAVMILSAICLSETYEPVLLRRKAAKLRKETGNTALRSKLDNAVSGNKLRVFRRATFMSLRTLFLSPSILLVSFVAAIGYSYLYILYTTLSTTFSITYAWKPKKVGFAYVGIAVGALIGIVASAVINNAIIRRRTARGGSKPGNRWAPMIFFFLWPFVSIGLLIYGWTAQYRAHWIGPMIGTAVFSCAWMSSMTFISAYISNTDGMAASSILCALAGGLAPLSSEKLLHKFGVGWSFSILAFVTLAFSPLPWIIRGNWKGKEQCRKEIDSYEGASGLITNEVITEESA